MSLPKDTERDPRADALLTSALSAADGVEAGGCPDAEVIGLYAERELAGAELRAVEAHVHTCPRCQATVAAFVRALPDETADAARAVSGAAEAGGGFAAWFAGWRWLVPAASLTAVALVAVWVGRGPADQVAESARGAAAMIETDAAAPAAERALRRPPEAFVPQAGASTSGAAGAARGATADAAAKSAVPVEARRKQATALADRAAAANAAPGTTVVGSSSGLTREAAPAAAPVQEALTVSQAAPPPAAPAIAPAPAAAAAADAAAARARTTTFSALTFTPWRAVNGRVERSRDDGATWEGVATPEGVRVIAAGSPGGDICWLVVEDGVLRTTNGRTWTRTTRPTSEPLSGVVAASADRASVFSASGRRWETTDGGRTWSPAP